MRTIAKSKNKFYDIKNSSDSNIDIYVYGEIVGGSDKWDESDVTFTDFKDTLENIDTSKTVNLYINSCGGSVFTTQGIVAMLQRVKAKGVTINAYIDGIGASCASFMPMVADNIYCYSSSILMVHHPMSCCWGNVNDFNGQIDLLNKIEDSVMMPLYMDKVKDGVTEDKIKDLIDKETWLSAKEMTELFNITLLEDEKKLTACINDKSILNCYKNVPKSILNQVNKAKTEDKEDNKDKELQAKQKQIENALKQAEIFVALEK
ncbi:head maturation protease, ClpP-related [Clostridium botulinum]|uniref:head maturation protease, ClpP-related n=1 Tax=Clostridium botulinum TaxID=1491 RepID=UPI001E4865FD